MTGKVVQKAEHIYNISMSWNAAEKSFFVCNGHISDHQQGVNKPDTNIEKKVSNFLPVDDVAEEVIDWLLMCGCMCGGVYVSKFRPFTVGLVGSMQEYEV